MLTMNRGPSHTQELKVEHSSRPPGVGRQIIFLVCLGFVLGMAATGIVLWATSVSYGEIPIEGAPLIAAMLGGGGAMAIGVALMALLFHSNRSGWDDRSG